MVATMVRWQLEEAGVQVAEKVTTTNCARGETARQLAGRTNGSARRSLAQPCAALLKQGSSADRPATLW